MICSKQSRLIFLSALALLTGLSLDRASAAKPGDALITVEVIRNHLTEYLPGLVVLTADEQSYVVVHQSRDERIPPNTVPAFTILRGAQKRIAAQLQEDKNNRSTWVLTAAAKELPAPATIVADSKLKTSQPLKVISLRIDPKGNAQQVTADATVDKIFHYSLDELAFYELKMDNPKSITFALATTFDGQIVAYRGPWIGYPDEVQAWYPLDKLRAMAAGK